MQQRALIFLNVLMVIGIPTNIFITQVKISLHHKLKENKGQSNLFKTFLEEEITRNMSLCKKPHVKSPKQ